MLFSAGSYGSSRVSNPTEHSAIAKQLQGQVPDERQSKILSSQSVDSYKLYRHSLSDPISNYLSLSPHLCLSVCPAVKAYISVTIDWILMKLGESVGT